ncbi:pentapeptide repeat-containing protein [Embleya hyalina]|uniref:Pentapeptide repeat-containing protein n=1 Tax=Embleya hyalina TaxID=516124 RepID=A0A401YY56_9ACTN|nr:pentapeptide repeat-containing protein [Embleya hyalina]GCD99513.1 hypothetical protein EHYA_07235 [Embleya hyalina]
MPGHLKCLVHVTAKERVAHLLGLSPGDDVDLSGTTLTPDLVERLLTALRDPAGGRPRFGRARFVEAIFPGGADFAGVTFAEEARFTGAAVHEGADFSDATFTGEALFRGATIGWNADFSDTTFEARADFAEATVGIGVHFGNAGFAAGATFRDATLTDASFMGATFADGCSFDNTTFVDDADFLASTFVTGVSFGRATFVAAASFDAVRFCGEVGFAEVTFATDASFHHTVFAGSGLGPFTCPGRLDLREAVFEKPVTIEAEAASVHLLGTRWEAPATLRLCSPDIDLSNAMVTHPLSITGVGESGARLISLRGVDVEHLALIDVDLGDCLFAGARRLDRLTLGGRVGLARTPTGRPYHTSRRVLAEERYWRGWAPKPGPVEFPRFWGTPTPPVRRDLAPADLAPLYRELGRAFAVAGNTADAADFRYGEAEMRRLDPERPRAERALLAVHRVGSGYGLRAARVLGWLAATMVVAVAALVLFGLPADAGGAGTAVRVVVHAAVLRGDGTRLTVVGTCVEAGVRVLVPVLLVLAALALRARLERRVPALVG